MAPQSSPLPSTQAKKQASISSFFTPKSSAPKSSPPAPEATTSGGHKPVSKEHGDSVRSTSGTKRSREDGEEHSPLARPQSKKKRPLMASASIDDSFEAGTLPMTNGCTASSSATQKNANGLKVSGRTSKYLFSSSPLHDENESDQDTEEKKQEKDRLHQRFVRKLGRPEAMAEIRRRNHTGTEDPAAAEEGEEEEGEEETPALKGRGRRLAATKKPKTLTPMEKQVVELKKSNMDTLLVVEVGYKFRFFGEDARIAAKELSIVCIPGKFRFDDHPSEAHLEKFASASIPVHRLHVHVKRLVAAGHKVGVVRQLETAALKAVGDNRNTPFVRKLTNLYTKGTYIDDVEGLEGSLNTPSDQAPATGYLLCMTETNAKGWGDDEKVHVGIVAVQPATGDIIYDDFEDGFMRSEIETRLLHIAPCEFLIVGEMSKTTEKLVSHLSGSKTNVFGDQARVERVAKNKTMAAEAFSHISNFYADRVKTEAGYSANTETATHVLDQAHQLSELVSICLSAMIKHMSEYGLEHVFDLTKYFQPFSARSHMLLNGNTLTSLEIYQNQTDHTEKGSLFWCINRTKTRFGHRLLRKWVGRPLLDKLQLEDRIAAVEELKKGEHTIPVDKLNHVLGGIKGDLEKSLLRIYYQKCTRPELLNVLQSLQAIGNHYAGVKGPESAGFRSSVLNEAITALPKISEDVVGYLERINPQAAKVDDKYNFFRDEYDTEDIVAHRLGIATIESELDHHRAEAAEKIKKKRVDYTTVAGIEYLIEIDNKELKNVPASWQKISGTKAKSRFHTPTVIAKIRERDQHKESLAAACDTAFKTLLTDISTRYQSLRDCIQALAHLDCLLSLATVASQPGYTKPTFTTSQTIAVQGARHPMVEHLLLDAYVPNDIHLSHDPNTAPRALLLTGPNMGGKSSYVRSVALTIILAQLGSYVPASSASLPLLDAVFTRMGAHDNMLAGESTFMVELSETADILKTATPRSLVLLDELGRGTSTHDGVAIASAVLEYVVREIGCYTLFVTHYQTLAHTTKRFPAGELRNVHMRFRENEGVEESEGEVTFLYEVGEGVAHRSYGLNVARLARVPGSVLEVAREKSGELEGRMRGVLVGNVVNLVARVMEEGDEDAVDMLVRGIEEL
ncbi:DNA mismatch repair protein MSH3 [Pseudovirgaria hyperparasitica]|uniref:MutS protein homolog 3 n=1 Tax=Pseudovirgaria hyperparasitica TaxID=470096 RepID=A0A6A6W8Q0_9PEZI|nr:DNA mismatch repair protein MSH3 [Pseudovirgaria hyperparasitica]KAF2759232.1 DNA mismatch repair protein MSH3 [Pseudovirgaria hyperparasitica]